MNLLNRLERSDHDLELDDLAVLVKAYELGGVDRDIVESRHEFENGIVLANDLTNVAAISLGLPFFANRGVRPRLAGQHVEGSHQIGLGESLALRTTGEWKATSSARSSSSISSFMFRTTRCQASSPIAAGLPMLTQTPEDSLEKFLWHGADCRKKPERQSANDRNGRRRLRKNQRRE